MAEPRGQLTESTFIGRAAELQGLSALVERARSGQGSLALVESESGMGKSRLLDEVAQRATRRGGWVLRSEGVHQAHRPFATLEGIFDQVSAMARADPELRAALRARLGEHSAALRLVAPELGASLGVAEGCAPGLEAYRQRALKALSALLLAIGSGQHPAVVVLDDAHLAGELELQLLQEWQRANCPRYTQVIAAAGADDPLALAAVRAAGAESTWPLRPLAVEETRSLVNSRAGPLPEPVLKLVVCLSAGSPFLAGTVLEDLVEQGALVAGEGGWVAVPGLLEEAHRSNRAGGLLAQRIERLPQPVQHLLSAGALLGRSFTLGEAEALARQSPAEALQAEEIACRRHLLLRNQGERCSFAHDQIREAFLLRMAPERARRLHLAAAERIEQADPSRMFELSYHFDAAGQPARAFHHALAAAQQACKRLDLEAAAVNYEIARRGAPDPCSRALIKELLSEVLAHLDGAPGR